MPAKGKTKGHNWEDDELVCFLNLWADPDVQLELESKVRNKPVYVRLALQVAAAGYPARDGDSCRDKVNRLKISYRKLRDEGRKSGQGANENLPLWYEIIHAVEGNKAKTCPVSTLDTGSGQLPPTPTPTTSTEGEAGSEGEGDREGASSADLSGSEYIDQTTDSEDIGTT